VISGLGVVLCFVGLGIGVVPMRASPAASVTGHVGVVLQWLVPAVLSVVAGAVLLGRARAIVGVAAAVVFGWVVMFHPVSDLIPDDDVPGFETVISLEERSARGEPFKRMDGHWYQVKPWVARALFF
jgi:hypothetical protein